MAAIASVEHQGVEAPRESVGTRCGYTGSQAEQICRKTLLNHQWLIVSNRLAVEHKGAVGLALDTQGAVEAGA
jgi:hypothetical protein